MTERMSDEKRVDVDILEHIVCSDERGEQVKFIDPDLAVSMATEILNLRADAETSQNHNAGVIDRIVSQLRKAGYTGTLSEMIEGVIATADGEYYGL